MPRALLLLLVLLTDVGLGLYLLHRLALWLEVRGHLFYLHRKPEGGGGNVLAPFQEIMQPSVKHVFEIKQQQEKSETDPGGPDDQ